jgi:hypothetical protein
VWACYASGYQKAEDTVIYLDTGIVKPKTRGGGTVSLYVPLSYFVTRDWASTVERVHTDQAVGFYARHTSLDEKTRKRYAEQERKALTCEAAQKLRKAVEG